MAQKSSLPTSPLNSGKNLFWDTLFLFRYVHMILNFVDDDPVIAALATISSLSVSRFGRGDDVRGRLTHLFSRQFFQYRKDHWNDETIVPTIILIINIFR